LLDWVKGLNETLEDLYYILSHFKCNTLNLSHSKCNTLNLSRSKCNTLNLSHSKCNTLNLSHFKGNTLNLSHSKCNTLNLSHFKCNTMNLSHFKCNNLNLSHPKCNTSLLRFHLMWYLGNVCVVWSVITVYCESYMYMLTLFSIFDCRLPYSVTFIWCVNVWLK
jgi:hypothetical protein